MPITIEDRRDFVENAVRVKLWLARHKAADNESLVEAVILRTDIYRLSDLWDGKNHPAYPSEGWRDPRWEALVAALTALHAQHPNDAAFEQAGLELFWPHLEPKLKQAVKRWPRSEERPFGFFSCDPPRDSPEGPFVNIHLSNPFAPRSPFEDMNARANELWRLLDDVLTKEPAPVIIRCGTWLNSVPAFQSLFPPEWLEGASQSNPGFHYGWWGQFVNRRGAFNHRAGEHLRKTGEFLYPCIGCNCRIEALRAHLKAKFTMQDSAQTKQR